MKCFERESQWRSNELEVMPSGVTTEEEEDSLEGWHQ